MVTYYYEDSENIGYKKLLNGWIAKLEILGQNNEKRNNIIEPMRAKYRCSKAKVLKIFKQGKRGIKITRKAIGGSYDTNFKYQVGKVVEVKNFDKNIDEVCSRGIHYFKSLECAKMWNLNPVFNKYTGTYKVWHDNGVLMYECVYKDGISNLPQVIV